MLNNPPGGNVGASSTARRILFSELQVSVVAFICGPLPSLYMLISNLRAMGQGRLLAIVTIGGYSLLMMELVVLLLIPSHSLVASLIAPCNTAAAAAFAMRFQPARSVILKSAAYTPAPLWRVLWIGVARTVETVAWLAGVVLVFYIAGIPLPK
jgi:hypothetical protein